MTALNLDRITLHPKTFLVRHDNGECFEVEALTIARARKLIEAESQKRDWNIMDVDWWEVEK